MLEDTIKDLKAQLEAEEKKEIVEEQAPAEEENPTEEPAKEEVKTAESAKEAEPVKEDTKPAEPDDAGYARLRREAAAAKKKAEQESQARADLEARLAKLENGDTEETTARQVDPEIEEVKQSIRFNKAEKEFLAMEESFKRSSKVNDYEAVSKEYVEALAYSIKVQNPRMSAMDVAETTKKQLLVKAANYLNQGFDPIEEMYHEAKELGFGKAKAEPKQEATAKEEPKPDMAKVAENRKRSSNMAATNGESKGIVTKQSAADYTNEEWQRLPVAEKRRLMYG